MSWLNNGILTYIITAVMAVEQAIKGTTGKEKQNAAMQLISVFIGITETLSGKDYIDDALVQDALRKAIDAVVAVQNAIASAKHKPAA